MRTLSENCQSNLRHKNLSLSQSKLTITCLWMSLTLKRGYMFNHRKTHLKMMLNNLHKESSKRNSTLNAPNILVWINVDCSLIIMMAYASIANSIS
jgi:hypothetical protein